MLKEQLKQWLVEPAPAEDLIDRVRRSPAAPILLDYMHRVTPDFVISPTTYTLYREFERSGERKNYERVYFARRSMLTHAVLEVILGDHSTLDVVQDLLWSICEETTWVLPAHEEQGPDYWDLRPSPRQIPYGAHTLLTRDPDSIDLFAAETGASLAEAVHFLGDRLAPEVVQRVRQEVERHIFKPYLAHGRKHWWYKGALNWNGVCNGSIGLAFMRLEWDPETLAEAIVQVLEGLEAYIATGFEPDGGSIEGIGYWNYGLMYYVTLSELLRERTHGQLDLLAAPRMRDIAAYAPGMALSTGVYMAFGDATEELAVTPGMVTRLAERTGVDELRELIITPSKFERGFVTGKLAIMLRDVAWWDGTLRDSQPSAHHDFFLPDCAIVKFAGQTATGKPVTLAAKAGHNDGHHSHTDIGSFVYHVDGESLLVDPGRGKYSREYFREPRYDNIFCNSIGHSVPRIGGRLQAPGPEFGGHKQFHGAIVDHGEHEGEKFAVIDFHRAYALPTLALARRTLSLNPNTGETSLEDVFAFDGAPLEIEEAIVTWANVEPDGSTARVIGQRTTLELTVQEPDGAVFHVQRLEDECHANQREGVLTRLTVTLPQGTPRFRVRIFPRA